MVGAQNDAIRYLTLQDVIWINLQVAKKVHHFNYARLEEAVFYQYGYGGSKDIVKQAGQFANGFVKLHPFEAGNEATGFVSVAAFLALNGYELRLDDVKAEAWFAKIAERETGGIDAVREAADGVSGAHGAPVSIEAAVEGVLAEYPNTIRALAARK